MRNKSVIKEIARRRAMVKSKKIEDQKMSDEEKEFNKMLNEFVQLNTNEINEFAEIAMNDDKHYWDSFLSLYKSLKEKRESERERWKEVFGDKPMLTFEEPAGSHKRYLEAILTAIDMSFMKKE